MEKMPFISLILSFLFCTPLLGENLTSVDKKQKIYEDKWKNKLKSGMSEDQILSILEKPRLIWRSSSRCIYFYEELPETTDDLQPRESVSLFDFNTDSLQDYAEARKYEKTISSIGDKLSGCVEFYYGEAVPSEIIEASSGQSLPMTIRRPNGILVKHNERRGNYGLRADFYLKEIPNPEKMMYRMYKVTTPDFVNVHHEIPLPEDIWNDLSEYENKENWQDPVRWKRLSVAGRSFDENSREIFNGLTEQKMLLLLGEPHRKINQPGVRIWQYGDVSGDGEQTSPLKGEGFGRIIFLQDKKGAMILHKWSEPFWPDIKENMLIQDNNSPVTAQ